MDAKVCEPQCYRCQRLLDKVPGKVRGVTLGVAIKITETKAAQNYYAKASHKTMRLCGLCSAEFFAWLSAESQDSRGTQ